MVATSTAIIESDSRTFTPHCHTLLNFSAQDTQRWHNSVLEGLTWLTDKGSVLTRSLDLLRGRIHTLQKDIPHGKSRLFKSRHYLVSSKSK